MGRFALPSKSTKGYCLSLNNEYNQGREINTQVLDQMVNNMMSGYCYIDRNPVLVAIDPGTIDTRSLDKEEPSEIKFKPGKTATIYILDGLHRITAAKAVVARLMPAIRENSRTVSDEQKNLLNDTCDNREQIEQDIARFQRGLNAMKDVVDLVRDWPAHVYSKSKSCLTGSHQLH